MAQTIQDANMYTAFVFDDTTNLPTGIRDGINIPGLPDEILTRDTLVSMYSATVNFGLNEVVYVQDSLSTNTYRVFRSAVANNVGNNPLTDTVNWTEVYVGSRPLAQLAEHYLSADNSGDVTFMKRDGTGGIELDTILDRLSEIPGIMTTLAGKQDTITTTSPLAMNLVQGLVAALAAKQDNLTGVSDVPGLQDDLNGKLDEGDVFDWALSGNTDDVPDDKIPDTIARLSDIPTGTLTDTDDLPEGTVNLYFTNARARTAVPAPTEGTPQTSWASYALRSQVPGTGTVPSSWSDLALDSELPDTPDNGSPANSWADYARVDGIETWALNSDTTTVIEDAHLGIGLDSGEVIQVGGKTIQQPDLDPYRTAADQDVIDMGKQDNISAGEGISLSSANSVSVDKNRVITSFMAGDVYPVGSIVGFVAAGSLFFFRRDNEAAGATDTDSPLVDDNWVDVTDHFVFEPVDARNAVVMDYTADAAYPENTFVRSPSSEGPEGSMLAYVRENVNSGTHDDWTAFTALDNVTDIPFDDSGAMGPQGPQGEQGPQGNFEVFWQRRITDGSTPPVPTAPLTSPFNDGTQTPTGWSIGIPPGTGGVVWLTSTVFNPATGAYSNPAGVEQIGSATAGPAGPAGADGMDGADGSNGETPNSVSASLSGDDVTFTFGFATADDISTTGVDLRGPQGEQGDTGAQGFQGVSDIVWSIRVTDGSTPDQPTAPTGDGITADSTPTGWFRGAVPGTGGVIYQVHVSWNPATSSFGAVGTVYEATGEQGPAGTPGQQGPTGMTGQDGPQGDSFTGAVATANTDEDTGITTVTVTPESTNADGVETNLDPFTFSFEGGGGGGDAGGATWVTALTDIETDSGSSGVLEATGRTYIRGDNALVQRGGNVPKSLCLSEASRFDPDNRPEEGPEWLSVPITFAGGGTYG